MPTAAGRDPRSLEASPVVRVLLPFAGAYVLSYLYRSLNAVIAPDLVADFALSADQLGLLTSAYLLAFAAFQLPLGLLLDRFGPRRTDASLLLIAALGALVFALAHQLPSLIVGRALIGLGVSGCLHVGHQGERGLVPDSTAGEGERLDVLRRRRGPDAGNGPGRGGGPAHKLANGVCRSRTAHRESLGLIFLAVPERRSEAAHEPLRAQLAGLRCVLGDRRFWQISLSSTTIQSTHMAVQGLWVGPWLRDVAGFGRDAVAWHLLMIACATTRGFLFWGSLATWLSRRSVSVFSVYACASGAFLLFQLLVTVGSSRTALVAWVGYGFFGTAGSLCYAILPRRFPTALAGRANTALNAMVFTSAFVVQWAMGAVINLWPAMASGYDPRGYRIGFALALAMALGAWVWMLSQARHVAARTGA
ncbi:MAG TPA: MFS transporter [Burkholderiales bacterium]|nr:MFS transporter [Burkholderiales bacterium]